MGSNFGEANRDHNGSIELKSFEVSHNGHLLAVTDRTKVGIREVSTGKHIYLKKSYDFMYENGFLTEQHDPCCALHCFIDGVTGRYIHFSEIGNYVSTVHELYHIKTDTEGHLVSLAAVDDRIKVEYGLVCLGKDKIL